MNTSKEAQALCNFRIDYVNNYLIEIFSDPITKDCEATFMNMVPHHQRILIEGAGET